MRRRALLTFSSRVRRVRGRGTAIAQQVARVGAVYSAFAGGGKPQSRSGKFQI